MADGKLSNLEALRSVWSKDSGLSVGERAVFTVLIKHRNQSTGQCTLSQPTIAVESGMSERGVRGILEQLERRGLLVRSNPIGKVAGYEFRLPNPGTSCRGTPAVSATPEVRSAPEPVAGVIDDTHTRAELVKEQITDKRIKPSRNGVPKKSRDTWLTPYGEVWENHAGGKPSYGTLAHVLAESRKEHGDDVLLPAWRKYVTSTEPRFLSAPKFVSTLGSWLKAAKPRFSGYS